MLASWLMLLHEAAVPLKGRRATSLASQVAQMSSSRKIRFFPVQMHTHAVGEEEGGVQRGLRS